MRGVPAQLLLRGVPSADDAGFGAFFGRRVYVGLIFVLLPALLGSEGPTAASAACRKLHLSFRTTLASCSPNLSPKSFRKIGSRQHGEKKSISVRYEKSYGGIGAFVGLGPTSI